MNKIIYSRFDKSKIGELPRATFPGRIVTILSAGEAERAADFLLTSDILGFDTETRPVFTKGNQRKVALLQVSNRDTCFLFRLNRIGLCPAVKRLLEAEGPLKIGLSWHDDIASLRRRGEFESRGFIDLQNCIGDLGIKDMSLAKLFANLFGQRISKREQLSNWEADVLSNKQKLYAATDAWACIMLYEEYLRLKETQDFFLEIVPEPEPPQQNQPKAEQSSEKSAKSKGKASGKSTKSSGKNGEASAENDGSKKEKPKARRTYKRKNTTKKKNDNDELQERIS